MKLSAIPLLLATIILPGVVCGSPPPQTAAAVEVTQRAQPDPAHLLRNGKEPLQGLLTGGQPTTEQLKTLADLGYATIINLRGTDEQGSTDPKSVEALGMTYVSIPISGAVDINEENAHQLAQAMEASEGSVVLHCASGNRVGALLAMKAYHVDGISAEEALALGRAAGVTRLEPVVRQKLGLE